MSRPGGYQEITVIRAGVVGSVGSVRLHPYERGQTYLSDLEVSPEHRRHGVAKMLVQAAQRAASVRGYSGIVLEASPSAGNIDPQSLVSMYQRMGFRRTGLSERGKPLLEFGPATVQRKTASAPAAPPVCRPQSALVSQAKLAVNRPASAAAAPTIQMSRKKKKFVSVPMSDLGFKVERTPPPEVKINWSTVTDRDRWWDALGYTPKEGDMNCRISRLGKLGSHEVHATITKSKVPLKVDPAQPSDSLAKTLLGDNFHVTLETSTGNSGAHYFLNSGASGALQSATYNQYLDDMREKCFDEFQGVIGQIEHLLGRSVPTPTSDLWSVFQ